MFEKMTMREWSTNSTPTTPAPGLLSLAEPISTDTIVSVLFDLFFASSVGIDLARIWRLFHTWYEWSKSLDIAV